MNFFNVCAYIYIYMCIYVYIHCIIYYATVLRIFPTVRQENFRNGNQAQ